MPRPARRVQLIVVPATHKRSYSFYFYPGLLAAGFGLLVLVVAALAFGLRYFHQETIRLRAELAELEALKQQARLQQEELARMKATAAQVEQELQEIRQLEQDLETMTEGEDILPSRSGFSRSSLSIEPGRGGPEISHAQTVPALSLAAILPEDVSPYVVGKRNTLLMDLKLARLPTPMTEALQTSQAIRTQLAGQLSLLRDSARSIADGRDQLAAKLEYLAHRPSGWPLYGAEITDGFGPRRSPFGRGWQHHDGVDLAQDYWTPVYATGAGTVVYADWLAGGYGKSVIIDHGYGYRTLYAHLQDWNVSDGQEVSRGDLIGWVGSTGLSTGPHLHYEVLLNGVAVDPEPYLHSRPEE